MRLLHAYVAERLPLRLMLPVSGGLALAALAGARPTPGRLAAAAGISWLLVAQFRVWDDLADRPRDAIEHPRRVLVRTTSTMPVLCFCAGLAITNAVWVVARGGFGTPLLLLIALNCGYAGWYARRRGRTTAGDHLVLAKYPAIAAIAAGDRLETNPGRMLLAMASVYLAACVYEAWHDRGSPVARHRLLVASEAILLVIALAALSVGAAS